jgi:amino acid transporter
MFVSLGSIIGSGWLLGALKAAQVAGPASILSWLLAAAMLSLLALVYAELGAAYPVAGGGGRVAYFSHGPIAGFTAGWAAWLQAVFIAPIEVLAALTYINSVDAVREHFNMFDGGLLNGTGLVVAVLMMVLFTAINLAGAKFMSESNTWVVVWKTIVPFLAIAVVAGTQFDAQNFGGGKGGFMPYGWHGVFAALTGGVVFALQGFEQAVQLAGEAKNPKRDLSRAILTAMAIGAVLYTLLQVVMIGGFEPSNITIADKDHILGWATPLGSAPSAYGAWYTLAVALGIGWLAKALLVDAVISPAGTGVIYLGTSARLSYALGQEREMPSVLAKTNKRGVPVISTILAFVIGCCAFGPFKSWKDLVEVVTSTTAIMYSFAPVSLAALHRLEPDRERSYRVPMPKIVLPAAFCSANLIIYWTGFATVWKLVLALIVGLLLYGIGAMRARTPQGPATRALHWMVPWLGGHVLIGALGRYGDGYNVLPNWVDLGVMIAFSLAVYYAAVRITLTVEESKAAIAKDAQQLEYEELPTAQVVSPT